jgi:hypothetical protein
MADAPEVFTRPASYLVTIWPEGEDDHIDAAAWCVTVASRGHCLWAVIRGGDGGPVLDAGGRWAWEPIPSERDDEWRARHRFPLERALELAREQAPKVTINGMTAVQCLARYRQRKDGPGA